VVKLNSAWKLTTLVLACAPGLWAVNVRGFGAKGNGITDDTAAIQRAIDACPAQGTVTFPAGRYSVRGLSLKPRCTYAGTEGSSTLLLKGRERFLLDISERSDIHVTGLILDSGGAGGGIIARGDTPVRKIRIDNCEFKNVPAGAAYPADLAIISTLGLIDSVIENNRFSNVAAGIWLTTVQNVDILNNVFQDVTKGNAITVAPAPAAFPSGANLRIIGNTGRNLARMGIETFRPDPPNGSVLRAPIIENNTFTDWTAPNGMGISITHGDGGVIRGNKVTNASGPPQNTGIEVIITNAQVVGNTVSGNFADGILVIGRDAPTITGNVVTGVSNIGIGLACDRGRNRCASRNATISGNTIRNARLIGIKLDNDWSDGVISKNTIIRTAGAWPDDRQVHFSGIHQSPAPGRGLIEANTIVQDAAKPPSGFSFCGIHVNSSMPGSVITNNVFRSSTPGAMGTGIADNTGTATRGWVIDRNSYDHVGHP
jgi:parallel beta-helix repeat protein